MTAKPKAEGDRKKQWGVIQLRIGSDKRDRFLIEIPLWDAAAGEGGVKLGDYIQELLEHVKMDEFEKSAQKFAKESSESSKARTLTDDDIKRLKAKVTEDSSFAGVALLRMMLANGEYTEDDLQAAALATYLWDSAQASWMYIIRLGKQRIEVSQAVELADYDDSAYIYWGQSLPHADSGWMNKVNGRTIQGDQPKEYKEVEKEFGEAKEKWERDDAIHKGAAPLLVLPRRPDANEPVTNEPVTNEPVTNEPVTNEPVTNEPQIAGRNIEGPYTTASSDGDYGHGDQFEHAQRRRSWRRRILDRITRAMTE